MTDLWFHAAFWFFWSFRWYVIMAAVALVIIAAVLSSIEYSIDDKAATRVCLERGYAEMVAADGARFCVRLVDGNTEVQPLEDFLE